MDHLKKDVRALGIFLVLLFIAWLLTGGPEQARQSGSANNPIQRPVAPIDSGATYRAPLKEVSPIQIRTQKNAY